MEADDGEGGHRDAQGVRGQAGHCRVGGEQPHQQAGRERARRPSRHRHARADEDGPAQDACRAFVQPRPVVVADEGLDALVQPDDNHDDERRDAVDDAVSPDGQVAAVAQQLHVDEHHHEAQRQMHTEGREAEAEDGLHDAGLQAEASPAEAHVALPPQEVPHHPGRPHGVGHVRSPGRPRDAPAEAENEQRVEHHIDQRADNHRPHGLARVARGAHDAVEAVAQRREAGEGDDDAHVFLGVADGAFRAAEEGEDVVHERERQPDGRAGDDEREDEGVCQDALRLDAVALA